MALLVDEWKPGYWTPERVQAVCEMGDGGALLRHYENLKARTPSNISLPKPPVENFVRFMAMVRDAVEAMRELSELDDAGGVFLNRRRVKRFAQQLRGDDSKF